MENKALAGIKVIDLSRVLAGPYCTMILGDLGADIIKIEAPGGSDETRKWGPPFLNGESAYYLCTNRNKRAMTLNLKSEEGKEVLRQLILDSDVIIHNFKTGTMEKWELGYEQLKEINPKIVYCSISGFGETGPYAHLPGYDSIIQAMGGLMSITGTVESGPLKVGVAITDLVTGLYSAIGVLAALNERNRSGIGQKLDLSLFDSQISILANVASNYLISKKMPLLHGNQHPNIVPYQPFQLKDGHMVIAVGNDRQFLDLCRILNIAHVASDPRFSTNANRLQHREEIISLLQEELKLYTCHSLQQHLNRANIPCGPINNIEQVFQDPQIEARRMKIEVDHPYLGRVPLVGSPLKLSRTPVQYNYHPPTAGEHTREILKEFGFSEERITSLHNNETI